MFQTRRSFLQHEYQPAGGERTPAELVMSRDEEHEEENKENESFQCRLTDKWWIDADWEVNKAVWVRFKSSTPEESSSVQKQNYWLSFLLSSSERFYHLRSLYWPRTGRTR